MATLRLQFLHVNQAWAFTFGDSLLRLDDSPLLFASREGAVRAAARVNLAVADDGPVRIVEGG